MSFVPDSMDSGHPIELIQNHIDDETLLNTQTPKQPTSTNVTSATSAPISKVTSPIEPLQTSTSNPSQDLNYDKIAIGLRGIPTREYYYKDRSGEAPEISQDVLGISSIKTYYPTEEEFKDPYGFIKKIEEKDKVFGAAKIVPPPSWNPKFALDLTSFRFRAVKQSLKKATSDYGEKVQFYKDLLEYHSSTGHPLQRLPSIDKKILDLYNLRRSVRAKGGFTLVCSKKMWAQVGRELGYTGRIMTSLSSSLKLAYMKLLASYDDYVDGLANSSSEVNESSKRPMEMADPQNVFNNAKKPKLSPEISAITNSRNVLARQKDILKSKGFKTNFESYTDETQGITIPDDLTYPFYDPSFWHNGTEVSDALYSASDITREYNFQQFYGIHLKNSKLLLSTTPEIILGEFWRIIDENDNFNVETALNLPSKIYGSGFPTTNKVESDIEKEDVIHPWNLNNLPLNEEGFLRYLPDDNDSITKTKLTVSMMHSVSTWSAEDHFLSLADYLHIGAFKMWYFISPQDQGKYEELLKLKTQEYEASLGKKDSEGLSESIMTDILHGLKQSDNQRKRQGATNSKFDRFYEHEIDAVRLNSDFLISPTILKKNGIRVHCILQKPGEFIIKFPSTYSASVSLGGSLSENVNFATINWIDHASHGSLWLENQKLIPKLSITKVLINVIEENKDPEVLKRISPLFHNLIEKELILRTNLKTCVSNMKIVQNKFDYIADDTLRQCFPTKVVVYDGEDSFILDPYTFLVFWHEKIKDMKVELHIFYSDDKLKSYQKTASTFAQHPTDWVKKFDDLINAETKPSLKQLKSIYNDGERLSFDIPEVNTLKKYLDFANQWVEKAQELLACKQKNRIRNRVKQNQDTEEKAVDIELLEELLKELPNLAFTCPEIDLLIELGAEVYQYESSVRTFLNEKEHNTAEITHMIDLGKSFGVKLKSVEFLERIIARLSWKKRVSNTLDNSTDLNDYIALLDEGYTVCGNRDDGLLTIVRQKIKNGKFLGARIKYELTAPKFTMSDIEELFSRVKYVPIDPKIIKELNEIKAQYLKAGEERDKLYKTITLNSIDLLNLRSQREKKQNGINYNSKLYSELSDKFDGSFNDPRPQYSEAKSVLESSKGLLQMVSTSPIDGYLRRVEEWLKKAKRLFGKTNAPFNVLRVHLETLLEKAYAPLNIDDVYKKDQKISDMSPYFCICRHLESGVMIECEKCSEWYHCRCLKIGRGKAKRREPYVCPVCDYRLTIPREYNSPKLEDLEKVVIDGALLDLKPDELDIIYSIWKHADNFRKFLKEELTWFGNRIIETDVAKVKFYLRKLEGSCVLLQDEYNQLRHLVWKLSPVCEAEPPTIVENISKTKRVRKATETLDPNLPLHGTEYSSERGTPSVDSRESSKAVVNEKENVDDRGNNTSVEPIINAKKVDATGNECVINSTEEAAHNNNVAEAASNNIVDDENINSTSAEPI